MEENFNYIKKSFKIDSDLKRKKYKDNDIIHFKKILTRKECNFIIETCEKYFNWNDATTFGNLENYRKTKMIPLTNIYGFNHETFKAHSILGYYFKYTFNFFSNHYSYNLIENQINYHINYNGDEGFQILKYEPGNFYKEHIDQGLDLKRKYSVIIYLNDDYEGGETLFTRQNLKIKGDCGDILYFPSTYNYPHVAQEIKSGIKYTAVLWGY